MAKGDEGIKRFANFLAEACDGDINSEASVELKTLIEAIEDSRIRDGGTPGGQLQVTIKLKHTGKALDVRYEIATKKPPRKRAGGTCWITKENNFTFRNPKQQELAFTDVSKRPEVAEDAPKAPRLAEVQ